MEMIGRYNPTDKTAAIPEHLKEVQVEWKWLMRKFTKFSSFFVHLTYVRILVTLLMRQFRKWPAAKPTHRMWPSTQ
jgi:NADH:ubiquinone oxidoreductase subunit E